MDRAVASYGRDTNLIVPPIETIFEITDENSHGNSACKKVHEETLNLHQREMLSSYHFFCLSKFYCVFNVNI